MSDCSKCALRCYLATKKGVESCGAYKPAKEKARPAPRAPSPADAAPLEGLTKVRAGSPREE